MCEKIGKIIREMEAIFRKANGNARNEKQDIKDEESLHGFIIR